MHIETLYERDLQNAVPFSQEQIRPTIEWVFQNVFSQIGISKHHTALIGSAGKKPASDLSGDIDIAVFSPAILHHTIAGTKTTIGELDNILKNLGLWTMPVPGFNQISIGAPIAGDWKNGVGQVDLMLTENLEWSKFIYYSPDFRIQESAYKGAYRNLLLMAAFGKCFYEIIKKGNEDEVLEYQTRIIRLSQGIVQVRKSYEGKKGLLKKPVLLREHDLVVTQDSETATQMLFPGHNSADINTYERLYGLICATDFKFAEKRNEILIDFCHKLRENKLSIPEDIYEKSYAAHTHI